MKVLTKYFFLWNYNWSWKRSLYDRRVHVSAHLWRYFQTKRTNMYYFVLAIDFGIFCCFFLIRMNVIQNDFYRMFCVERSHCCVRFKLAYSADKNLMQTHNNNTWHTIYYIALGADLPMYKSRGMSLLNINRRLEFFSIQFVERCPQIMFTCHRLTTFSSFVNTLPKINSICYSLGREFRR